MKFFAVAALATVALAQYSALPAEETCKQVTVTITSTLAHTPSAPGYSPTSAPYPTTGMPKPSVPVGTGVPSKPVQPPVGGTGYPMVPSGVPKPSGTGAYSAPPTQFTGAASGFKVGGVVAAGAVAAFFL